MALISIRLPDEIENGLSREATRSRRSKSEIARVAIAEYLGRQERERYLAGLEAAASAIANDPGSRREVLQIAEEFLPLEEEAWAVAEPHTAYGAPRTARGAKNAKKRKK
jgi:predicted transcriptional regulator